MSENTEDATTVGFQRVKDMSQPREAAFVTHLFSRENDMDSIPLTDSIRLESLKEHLTHFAGDLPVVVRVDGRLRPIIGLFDQEQGCLVLGEVLDVKGGA